MLGPSGCGKTTTLRMIAGFEDRPRARSCWTASTCARRRTSAGQHGVSDLHDLPAPDVYENVAFGLRRQRRAGDRRGSGGARAGAASAAAKRKPSQLSGGQQQRVALARALVLQPSVLLLDEPLGALDAKLRRRCRSELKALQQRVGITFVYVTHDQEEALTMSDRIAVMSDGLVEQVGTPQEVYDEPTTEFVADFLGSPT